MQSNFLPTLDKIEITAAHIEGNYDLVYELLVEPLHEELYKRQDFNFIDELSEGQQLILAYDYLRTQVLQGGFIQFIQNEYVGLLPSVIEQLMMISATDMASLLDDVLKVYVLNRDMLNRPTTVEEFAKLYEEFKEFEILDERFIQHNLTTERMMLDYAVTHLGEFVA
ncbi:MAG: DUF4375 domain-containing protein [Taibaiella sp.]|nr:DUF4375 domain-containing protein [Taibaiella sp.]